MRLEGVVALPDYSGHLGELGQGEAEAAQAAASIATSFINRGVQKRAISASEKNAKKARDAAIGSAKLGFQSEQVASASRVRVALVIAVGVVAAVGLSTLAIYLMRKRKKSV